LEGDLRPAPWIASFVNDPAKDGKPGFWPINIDLGNSDVRTPEVVAVCVAAAQQSASLHHM
jgi:hypothetical protein